MNLTGFRTTWEQTPGHLHVEVSASFKVGRAILNVGGTTAWYGLNKEAACWLKTHIHHSLSLDCGCYVASYLTLWQPWFPLNAERYTWPGRQKKTPLFLITFVRRLTTAMRKVALWCTRHAAMYKCFSSVPVRCENFNKYLRKALNKIVYVMETLL